MNEEIFAADPEDRYFSRLSRRARADENDDAESEHMSRKPFSSDYFSAIWEGRN